MDALAWFAMGVTALVGQFINRSKSVPDVTVKAGLAIVGLAFYALGHGLPQTWWGPALSEWLDPGLVWALATVGTASMVGSTVPGMKSNSV